LFFFGLGSRRIGAELSPVNLVVFGVKNRERLLVIINVVFNLAVYLKTYFDPGLVFQIKRHQ
jgi:hypothetical protein